MYTPEGQKITERLWEETISELEFAEVSSILHTISQGNAVSELVRDGIDNVDAGAAGMEKA